MKKPGLFFLLLFFAVTEVFSTPAKKQLILTLVDSTNGLYDETILYFDIGTSSNYVFPEDAPKEFDSSFAAPQIYSFTSDSVACYSNGDGNFTAATVVPIGIRVQGRDTYTFTAAQIFNFDPTSIIRLEDRLLGTFQDLRTGNYTVPIDSPGNYTGRFFIHISYPPAINSIQAGCANNDGIIAITQDSSIQWSTCKVYDSTALISVINNANGNFNFTGLKEGTYNVEFSYGNYLATKTIVVTGNQVIAAIGASTTHAGIGQTINFTAEAVNATQYFWNFGDSTIVAGVANPHYAYQDSGIYNVSLKCSNNYPCSSTALLKIYVAEPEAVQSINGNALFIKAVQKNIMISLSNASEGDYRFEVYNVIGELMKTSPITSSELTVDMNAQAAGIYIVTVRSPDSSWSQKIFLQ